MSKIDLKLADGLSILSKKIIIPRGHKPAHPRFGAGQAREEAL